MENNFKAKELRKKYPKVYTYKSINSQYQKMQQDLKEKNAEIKKAEQELETRKQIEKDMEKDYLKQIEEKNAYISKQEIIHLNESNKQHDLHLHLMQENERLQDLKSGNDDYLKNILDCVTKITEQKPSNGKNEEQESAQDPEPTPRRPDYEQRVEEYRANYIRNQKMMARQAQMEKQIATVRVYANDDEKQRMMEAHPFLIEQMRGFVDGLKSMKSFTALEVACGECHVTRDYLMHKFFRTDLMDQCPESIKLAEKLQVESGKIGDVKKSSMQDFMTINKYNCIVLRYCIGYLDDDELVQFLQKLGTMLAESKGAS